MLCLGYGIEVCFKILLLLVLFDPDSNTCLCLIMVDVVFQVILSVNAIYKSNEFYFYIINHTVT